MPHNCCHSGFINSEEPLHFVKSHEVASPPCRPSVTQALPLGGEAARGDLALRDTTFERSDLEVKGFTVESPRWSQPLSWKSRSDC